MPRLVDHDQRRAEIIDAMWDVVDAQGAAAVSVRTVAAAAGMSKTNISHYFPTIGQLVGQAVAQTVSGVAAQAEKLDLDNCTVDIATQALLVLIPTTAIRRRQADVWLMLLSRHDDDPSLQPVLRELNSAVRAGISTLLQALADNGLIDGSRDIEEESAVLHAVVDGLSLQTLADRKFMPVATVKRIVGRHLEQLVVPI